MTQRSFDVADHIRFFEKRLTDLVHLIKSAQEHVAELEAEREAVVAALDALKGPAPDTAQ